MEGWRLEWVDYYELLEVSPSARVAVIQGAYKKLAAEYHPDKDSGDAIRMRALNDAKDTLTDEPARRDYDLEYRRRDVGRGRDPQSPFDDRGALIDHFRSVAAQERRAEAAERKTAYREAVERQRQSVQEFEARPSTRRTRALGKIKRNATCRLGIHKGERTYAGPDSCQQSRVCIRCGKVSARVKHVWAPAVRVFDDACEFITFCSRCGDEEESLKHDWSWRYTGSTCQQDRICDHCDETEVGSVRIHHQWSWWTRARTDEERRTCIRCGKSETRAIEPAADVPQLSAPRWQAGIDTSARSRASEHQLRNPGRWRTP